MRRILYVAPLLFWVVSLKAQFNKEASVSLIKRIVPKHASRFTVEYIPKEDGKDVFELESKGNTIVLRGNDGISIASALNYYLKHYAHADIGWNTYALQLPVQLPAVPARVHKVSPHNMRYAFNYCTFNYSASWWDWDRWERTIDWMAMNGINMPLALTGQNSVWDRVYRSLGFSSKEMDEFFTGPAYFNWFWMGNMDAWGGPLSQSFLKKHEDLQKKILARERELGMKTILPAFTGHVPRSFKDHYPNAKLHTTTWGTDFPSVAFSYMLDPNDPMFIVIGKKFIEEQQRTFGTDHLYSADTFNEMLPPSNDSTFLDKVGKNIYGAMTAADPDATWVMQGWMFGYSPNFWQPTQMKALLNAVQGNNLIVLDLWSEIGPLWEGSQAFYGKPWIWCMLHNFGGTNSLYGDMKRIADWPAGAMQSPKKGNMSGIGLTMEAIDQNPAVYALMMENMWRDKAIDLDSWLVDYAQARYGKKNANAEKAWTVLKNTVYSGQPWWGTASMISGRPTLKKEAKWTHTGLHYKTRDLLPAWEYLLAAVPELKNSQGFQHDLVDVTRQVIANHATYLQQQFAKAYQEKDMASYKKYRDQFVTAMDDLDKLLATRKDFLLGKWINDAKRYGSTEKEKALFEQNARNLITTWGDKDCGIHDYAWKQWAGLIKGFYKPRWQEFFTYLDQQAKAGQPVNEEAFTKQIKDWEWKWVNSREPYSETPQGDAIATAKAMYNKYAKQIK